MGHVVAVPQDALWRSTTTIVVRWSLAMVALQAESVIEATHALGLEISISIDLTTNSLDRRLGCWLLRCSRDNLGCILRIVRLRDVASHHSPFLDSYRS